jgi:branched-subunit amino acid ABC-type transport system permease component
LSAGDIIQALANGVLYGTLLTLPAMGLTIIYAVLRFPSFAVAAHATVGAFAGYVANAMLGLPLVPAFAAAFITSGLVGVISDEAALRPLRGRSPLTVAIASIALAIVLENTLRFAFGNELRGYEVPLQRDWIISGIRVGPQQLANLAVAMMLMTGIFTFFKFTRIGKAMRAVADNPMLAAIRGVNPIVIRRFANFLGMALAGLGGMLIALDTSVDPLIGFRILLPVFAAAIVGGMGSVPGAVFGGLTIGIAEQVSLLVIPPIYRTAVSFIVILLVLTIRPAGLFGERAN